HKVMEFVSLAVKPLEAGLAQRIATFLADTPGLFSDRWFGMIREYLEVELPKIAAKRPQLKPEAVAREYRFWFTRQRVDSRNGKVPKSEVRQIYQYLHLWAKEAAEEAGGSMLVLANQSQQIVELLDTLPEAELSQLELERVIRTIYQPAPINYQAAERGHCPTVHHPGAIVGPVTHLIWWDFIEQEPNYFFSRWYPSELRALARQGVVLESPKQENQRLLAHSRRPVLATQEQLILCLPDHSDGQAVDPHALYSDLEAAFGVEALQRITLQLDEGVAGEAWSHRFVLPAFAKLAAHPLAGPRPFLQLKKTIQLRDTETPTSLETLLYYPYQWIFRHHIKLRQSSILSVIDDNRLFGQLAHRLLEQFLATHVSHPEQAQVYEWVEAEIPKLLRKEGATLLQYGREPELIAFTKYMKFATWSLMELLKSNGWQVEATEKVLEGDWEGCPLKGRADLVLKRGTERAIIDLKWRGKTRYANLLRSREDLQLALYADLLRAGQASWPHTAFYIIQQAQMLVRNTQAFKGLAPVQDETDHQEVYRDLVQVLAKTFRWRQTQLQNGQVEIRCQATAGELEDAYRDILPDILEMKQEDAYFDDYQVLIGLVR
ncbi:MAG: PD-(D/E)XK nuclease family protein, partial [Bacteroidetes bacterium]